MHGNAARATHATHASHATPTQVIAASDTSGASKDASVKLTMSGAIADFTTAVLDKIKSDIATDAGCSVSAVSLTVAAGSVVVTATLPTSAASKLADNIKSGKVQGALLTMQHMCKCTHKRMHTFSVAHKCRSRHSVAMQ